MERQCIIIISLLFQVLCVTSSLNTPRVQVTINQGTLEGTTLTTDNGIPFDVFYGIPFAKPPIGQLRFKDPEPGYDWEGIRDATVPGPICIQPAEVEEFFMGVEDCLYLNVYVPKTVERDELLPVMFFIHGGAYLSGFSNMYDSRYFIEKEVIVVTTNYRLGILGFLALGNSDVPGNAALKDIVMSLEWVQQNIQHFGGNPNSITAFGESAGGSLTSFLLLSPLTDGLLHKAILQSGMATNEWAVQDNPEILVSRLFDNLDIESNNDQRLLEVLQELPAGIVVLIGLQVNFENEPFTSFKPVVEGDYSVKPFLPEDPKVLFEYGNFMKIPVMAGIMSQEGIVFLLTMDLENVTSITDLIPDMRFFIPREIQDQLSPEDEESIINKIYDFYFSTDQDLIEQFIDLNSDFMFVKDIDKYTRKIAEHSMENVYFYHFSYNGAWNFFRSYVSYNYTGAAHADELGYMFHIDFLQEIPGTEQDYLIRKQLIELWTNFAKFGDPNVNTSEIINVVWEPATNDDLNCLNIDREVYTIEDPYQGRMEFWRELQDLYGPKNKN